MYEKYMSLKRKKKFFRESNLEHFIIVFLLLFFNKNNLLELYYNIVYLLHNMSLNKVTLESKS